MAQRTKKLMNAADDIVREMIEGLCGAAPEHVYMHPDNWRAVIARSGPRPGKVGVLVGGGSGHEPAFVGYVGKGMADAAAIGNVFASPSPDPVEVATRAISGGAGVLYLYGNYAGDVMNFDMAADLVGMDGIEVRTVLGIDDVASAPPGEIGRRRGIAGGFFLFKCAGAAADLGRDLDGVEKAARHAVASMRTMGVALEPCSLPHTLVPNFTLGADEMEIGLGIHGEPGVQRGPLRPADAVTDDLVDRIVADMPLGRGDRVAVLVNGLGATSLMELYVMHRRVKQRLDDIGVSIHRSHVGEYVTSLEMAGASVTLMQLDGDLQALLDHPVDACMYRQA